MIVLLGLSRRLLTFRLSRLVVSSIHRLQNRIITRGRFMGCRLVMRRGGIDRWRLHAMVGGSPMIGFCLRLDVRRCLCGRRFGLGGTMSRRR